MPPSPKSRDEIRQEHHDFLHGLERRGVLLAAGLSRNSQGKRYGCGMMILRAAAMRRRMPLPLKNSMSDTGCGKTNSLPGNCGREALAKLY